jgi:HTH-type transcriptional regulator, sugar sensing transcriptional regulator
MLSAPKHLEQSLIGIGFEEKEAKIYLALLQLGPSDALKISLASGIKKPTTYAVLDQLRQKDAVLFLPNAKKKLFSAKKPEEVIHQAQQRFNKAYSDLPLLNVLAKNPTRKTLITYYEGKSGYSQAMQYKESEVAKEGELLSYYATADNIDPDILKAVDEYIARLKRQNVHLRAFAPDHQTIREYQQKFPDALKDTKIVPYNIYNGKTSIDISKTFVRFTMFEEKMFIIIDNTEIANMMRLIFEMNWTKY